MRYQILVRVRAHARVPVAHPLTAPAVEDAVLRGSVRRATFLLQCFVENVAANLPLLGLLVDQVYIYEWVEHVATSDSLLLKSIAVVFEGCDLAVSRVSMDGHRILQHIDVLFGMFFLALIDHDLILVAQTCYFLHLHLKQLVLPMVVASAATRVNAGYSRSQSSQIHRRAF